MVGRRSVCAVSGAIGESKGATADPRIGRRVRRARSKARRLEEWASCYSVCVYAAGELNSVTCTAVRGLETLCVDHVGR